MKTYEEYIKACVECTDEIYNEEEYKEITSRFKDVDVSFDDFNPYDDSLEYYIVRQLLVEKFGDRFWVDEIDDNDIFIEPYNLEALDILDDVKKFLESLGYSFENYESLKEEINENIEEDERDKVYDKAKDIIYNMSTNELKEFVNNYGTGNQ